MNLYLDPATHTYYYEGKEVPGLTRILGVWKEITLNGFKYMVNTYSGDVVASEKMKKAADMGTAIHKACAYLLTGEGIDWGSLDDSLVFPLHQFIKWTEDFRIKPVCVEAAMYSKEHGFAGTPDIVCNSSLPNLIVCEIKTGGSDGVGPQTAAQEMLFREDDGYRKRIDRYCLELPKDGSPYRFKKLTNSLDGAFFLARKFQYNFLKEN